MPAIGSKPRTLALSHDEEKLIRAVRVGDFQAACLLFERIVVQRREEDSAIVRQLREEQTCKPGS